MRMVRRCLLSLVGIVALPVMAQPAYVRTIGSGAPAAPSVTIPVTVTVPRSNTVFVILNYFPTANSMVTDSRANAYALELSYNNNGLTTAVYRGYVAVPLVPGDQITVTAVPSATSAAAYEFSGVWNAARESVGTTGGVSGNGFATTSATTTQSNQLLLAYVFRARNGGTASTVTPDPAYTPLLDFNGLLTAFRVASSPGSYDFAGTLNPPPDGNYSFVTAQVAAFRSFRSGDLNGDGNIDVFDVVVLASAIVGNVAPGTSPFTSPFAAADVNRDGIIDLFDLILLNGFIVGNVAALPV